MPEPPICEKCGARHWFLDPCGGEPAVPGAVEAVIRHAAGATVDEVEKALRFYRAHKERQKNRMRQKRAGAKKGAHKG